MHREEKPDYSEQISGHLISEMAREGWYVTRDGLSILTHLQFNEADRLIHIGLETDAACLFQDTIITRRQKGWVVLQIAKVGEDADGLYVKLTDGKTFVTVYLGEPIPGLDDNTIEGSKFLLRDGVPDEGRVFFLTLINCAFLGGGVSPEIQARAEALRRDLESGRGDPSASASTSSDDGRRPDKVQQFARALAEKLATAVKPGTTDRAKVVQKPVAHTSAEPKTDFTKPLVPTQGVVIRTKLNRSTGFLQKLISPSHVEPATPANTLPGFDGLLHRKFVQNYVQNTCRSRRFQHIPKYCRTRKPIFSSR